MDDILKSNRDFMKGYLVADFDNQKNDFNSSDQQKGINPPPLEKEYDQQNARIISLPNFDETSLTESNILTLIKQRRSRRHFTGNPLSLGELSYLLWATQGMSRIYIEGIWSIRTVPSAGARHPYETYLVINHVENLNCGVYRYLHLTHELLFL